MATNETALASSAHRKDVDGDYDDWSTLADKEEVARTPAPRTPAPTNSIKSTHLKPAKYTNKPFEFDPYTQLRSQNPGVVPFWSAPQPAIQVLARRDPTKSGKSNALSPAAAASADWSLGNGTQPYNTADSENDEDGDEPAVQKRPAPLTREEKMAKYAARRQEIFGAAPGAATPPPTTSTTTTTRTPPIPNTKSSSINNNTSTNITGNNNDTTNSNSDQLAASVSGGKPESSNGGNNGNRGRGGAAAGRGNGRGSSSGANGRALYDHLNSPPSRNLVESLKYSRGADIVIKIPVREPKRPGPPGSGFAQRGRGRGGSGSGSGP